jgi:hypothetical protein
LGAGGTGGWFGCGEPLRDDPGAVGDVVPGDDPIKKSCGEDGERELVVGGGGDLFPGATQFVAENSGDPALERGEVGLRDDVGEEGGPMLADVVEGVGEIGRGVARDDVEGVGDEVGVAAELIGLVGGAGEEDGEGEVGEPPEGDAEIGDGREFEDEGGHGGGQKFEV